MSFTSRKFRSRLDGWLRRKQLTILSSASHWRSKKAFLPFKIKRLSRCVGLFSDFQDKDDSLKSILNSVYQSNIRSNDFSQGRSSCHVRMYSVCSENWTKSELGELRYWSVKFIKIENLCSRLVIELPEQSLGILPSYPVRNFSVVFNVLQKLW